jgi:hypothetical protein
MHENIPLHVQKLNCNEGIHELEDFVGEKALGSILSPKIKLAKRTHLACFPNCILIST